MKELFVPQLGQTVEEVTLLHWLAANGSRVEEGDAVLEVETDKANFTVEANASGYLHRGPFVEGQVLPVLTVVAVIGKQDEGFPAAVQTGTAATAKRAASHGPSSEADAPSYTGGDKDKTFASPRARKLATARGVDLAAVTPTGEGGRRVVERDVVAYLNRQPRVTPLAQNRADEAGIDPGRVDGTGVGGRVTREDVERALVNESRRAQDLGPNQRDKERRPDEMPPTRAPLSGVRRIIAERMAASVHTTARVTLFAEADATELVAMRERLKRQVSEAWGFAPGYNDILAKMVAASLRRFPYMNARLTPEAIEQLEQINIGMAVDTDRGLLVPVVREVDHKGLRDFATEFRTLAGRARQGKALPDDLTGGTFTITNLGMYDVIAFTPVINLPEAAILGVGAITPQPVARDGQVVIRDMLVLSLVFDHRLVDGAPAARFLQHLKNMIQEPYLLLT